MSDDIKLRRSKVRMYVTYGAAAFVFLVATAIILFDLVKGNAAAAKDTFTTVLPVATAVVTYWFAGRSAEKTIEGSQDRNGDDGDAKEDQDTKQ